MKTKHAYLYILLAFSLVLSLSHCASYETDSNYTQVGHSQGRHPSSQASPSGGQNLSCKNLFKSLIHTSHPYIDALKSLESVSSRQNFNPLEGLSGLSEKDMRWKLSVKRSLAKLSNAEPLSARQTEKLVYHLYRKLHPEPLWKRFASRFMYLENAESLVIRRIHEELASKNVTEALAEIGLLRSNSNLENFKNILSQNQNKIQTALAMGFNAMIAQARQPFVFVPNISRMRNIDIPDNLAQRIFDEGVDALYPEIHAKYSSLANFDVAWQRFRYGVNSLITVYLIYSLPDQIEKIQDELQKSAMESFTNSFDSLEGTSDAEEAEWLRHLEEYTEFILKSKGREPSSEEIEEARVLFLYFSGGTI